MKTALPLLTLCSILGIAAGFTLDTYENILFALPGLYILVPVTIGMGGNVGAIFSARISSALHLGIIEFGRTSLVFKNNILATLIVGILSFFLVGVFGHLFCVLIGLESPGLLKMVLISTLSGILITVMVIIVATLSAFYSYNNGIDPDDTTIPIVTSISDVLGVLVLFGVTMVVL